MQLQSGKKTLHLAQVHKFGGSSLASAERFSAVADIIASQDHSQPVWVVVSAPGDTTDALLHIIDCVEEPVMCNRAIVALQQQLTALVSSTLGPAAAQPVLTLLQQWVAEIPEMLIQQQLNDILAIGERVSALLLSEVLTLRSLVAVAVDARDFLRLKQHQPDWATSAELLSGYTQAKAIHVVTGYIARDTTGQSITLGRNGSDYSATLLGVLVKAASVTIWTDVKAIYSADPRKVKQAIPYQQVSWSQACQLAQLGNPVLHARTLSPLTDTATALVVRSSYEPEYSGCRVAQQDAAAQHFITELPNVTLLTLHQVETVTATELSLALQQPVVALPQHGDNVSWLLPTVCAEQALRYLEKFQVNAVWDTQRYVALAYLKPCSSTSTQRVEALLQGHGLLHRYENAQQVIWLFAEPLPATVLEKTHQILLQAKPILQVVVAGTGNVGAEFLSMLKAQQQRLAAFVQIELAGVLNSRLAALEDSIEITGWSETLAQAKCWDRHSLLTYLSALTGAKVLIDITPSRNFATTYPDIIAAGCDIISANKQGVTLPGDEYQIIQQALVKHQRQWLSNTTCGAGIPVQRTLRELTDAGDEIVEVSGIFSGTLSWLLCKFNGSSGFSDFVLQAQAAGLTEPDPRDDLSGVDVQRKLLVLARELGLALELSDIELQPLLPSGLEQGDWQRFWTSRATLDAVMAQQYQQAQQNGTVLRYVASLTIAQGKVLAKVALTAVSNEHALASIAPCDNVFVIRSKWYNENPLVLKGPGAGKVVTAGGLHADLAVLVKQLVAKATSPAAALT